MWRRSPLLLRSGLALAAAHCAEVILAKSLTIGAAGQQATGASPRVVVVTERQPCALAATLEVGYRELLTSWQAAGRVEHTVLRFDHATFIEEITEMSKRHAKTGAPMACVLIQNNAFQNELKTYRLRLRLFELGFRVAEHNHLEIMSRAGCEAEMGAYFGACAFEPAVAHRWGTEIADVLNSATSTVIRSAGGHQLRYGKLERCLLNTGIYDGSHHEGEGPSKEIGRSVGGTFPIGEVITEAETLSDVSGSASFFAFPSTAKCVTAVEPFVMHIERGVIKQIEGTDGRPPPAGVVELIELVREVEGGEAIVRELGIGLNPAVGAERIVSDVTAFERQAGVHLSVGKRHPLFVKRDKSLRRKDGKFHIDIFLAATDLVCDSSSARHRIVIADAQSRYATGKSLVEEVK